MEINMIPMNPTIMYNLLEKNDKYYDIIMGQPIYNENKKLAGIVSKITNTHIYTIPPNYILNALNKTDNTKIYSLNEDIKYIKKINNFKVICNKIYCPLHKMYIPIESFIIINNNNDYLLLLNNGRIKKTQIIDITNNNYNNNLIINNNNITFTSGFLHLLKIMDKGELIERILINQKYDEYII